MLQDIGLSEPRGCGEEWNGAMGVVVMFVVVAPVEWASAGGSGGVKWRRCSTVSHSAWRHQAEGETACLQGEETLLPLLLLLAAAAAAAGAAAA